MSWVGGEGEFLLLLGILRGWGEIRPVAARQQRGVEGERQVMRATWRRVGQSNKAGARPIRRPLVEILAAISPAREHQEKRQRHPFAEKRFERLAAADRVGLVLRRDAPGRRVHQFARGLVLGQRAQQDRQTAGLVRRGGEPFLPESAPPIGQTLNIEGRVPELDRAVGNERYQLRHGQVGLRIIGATIQGSETSCQIIGGNGSRCRLPPPSALRGRGRCSALPRRRRASSPARSERTRCRSRARASPGVHDHLVRVERRPHGPVQRPPFCRPIVWVPVALAVEADSPARDG